MSFLIKGSLMHNDYELEVDDTSFNGGDRGQFFQKIDEIYNICPSDANMDFALWQKSGEYGATLNVLSLQGNFIAEAQSPSLLHLMQDLIRNMEKQFYTWKNQRFNKDSSISTPVSWPEDVD